ncbi:MAG: bifunctional DNA-formamidopyrimidine glycosylase/DNA-(apurinic or apyrimidinic site) lyase [Porticoccaceae bacterium]
MPELPEVETTLRGIAPHLNGRRIVNTIVRQPALRWPVPADLPKHLNDQLIGACSRRGKYLLLEVGAGSSANKSASGGHLLMHLGMSGNLRLVPDDEPLGKHDHVDIILDKAGVANKRLTLRFTDPRRFGAVLWVSGEPGEHKLLKSLGPEPLGELFTPEYLYRRSRQRKVPIKSFVMDSHVVVGVGNIYANEALFKSGIHPLREAGRISLVRYGVLCEAIKTILGEAIEQGGTTLRDFVGGDGKPGYFKQQLTVYGRSGEPCVRCASSLREVRVAQRSTVYCVRCQR